MRMKELPSAGSRDSPADPDGAEIDPRAQAHSPERDEPKCLRAALHAGEASLLEPAHCTLCHDPAGGAVQVADIVEQAAASLQHPKQMSVERRRIEISGELEGRRIVKDSPETLVRQLLYFLERVAEDLLDLRVVKERLRPW